MKIIECVPNFSEGVNTETFEAIKNNATLINNIAKERIKDELRASIVINASVQLHEPGFLPVSEGKAVRVVDKREKL